MIKMDAITKYYGNFRALNSVNMHVRKGEIIGLLGPNGAGKTTAMRILTTFLPATSGKATVAGYDVFDESIEVRKRLGYLPEIPPLYPEMSVLSYLNFIADIRDLSPTTKQRRIGFVVEKIGLKPELKRIIGTLSKGYRQRVGIAQALLHNPEVLILDEPTAGLDPHQIIEIRELIKDLAKDHTIILSTHILPEVKMTCDRAVIISEGEIVIKDSVENLEKILTDKPAWDILLKLSEAKKWMEPIQTIENAEILKKQFFEKESLVQFELRLKNSEDFETFFNLQIKEGNIFLEISPVKATLEEVFINLTRN